MSTIRENENFIAKFSEKSEIISEIVDIKSVENDNIVYKAKIISINEKTPKNEIFAETSIEKR